MLSEMPKIKCSTMTEWVNQQRSSGFIVTKPMIRLQALKWAEKRSELSVDFKATVYVVNMFS